MNFYQAYGKRCRYCIAQDQGHFPLVAEALALKAYRTIQIAYRLRVYGVEGLFHTVSEEPHPRRSQARMSLLYRGANACTEG